MTGTAATINFLVRAPRMFAEIIGPRPTALQKKYGSCPF
jgi:hypothetical protein